MKDVIWASCPLEFYLELPLLGLAKVARSDLVFVTLPTLVIFNYLLDY